MENDEFAEEDDSFETGPGSAVAFQETPETTEPIEKPEQSATVKSEDNDSDDECSVCRNKIVDVTSLNNCVHEFCYECIIGWLTKGSGQYCPMCKAVVEYIQRKETGERINVKDILANKEPEAVASEDLITEKRMVARKIRGCRRMMNRIDELIAANSRVSNSTQRQIRQEELHNCKQLCVSQLNTLQMLRDDIDHGAAKALVVSKVAFRRLVYDRHVIVDKTDAVLPTKSEFLANIEHYRSVLNSFLTIELKAMPVKDQPRIGSEPSWYFYTLSDKIEGTEELLTNQIFNLITETGSANLSWRQIDPLLEGRVSPRVLTMFVEELQSLIRSRKSYLEWCGSVRYRTKMDGRTQTQRNNEVYTVDDTDDLEESPPRRTRPTNRYVYNPLGMNHSFMRFSDPSVSRSSINPRASSSDTDHDDDIYFQAPLRMTGPSPYQMRANSPPKTVPSTGYSWLDLTSPSTLSSMGSSSGLRHMPFGTDRGVRKETTSGHVESDEEEDDDNDIQVVDYNGTIVLGDSVDDQPTSSQRPSSNRGEKRKFDERSDERRKRRKESLPDGLVDDVGCLLNKYEMTERNALNQMVAAVQTALHERSHKPKPDVASQFQNYLAKHGLSAPNAKPE